MENTACDHAAGIPAPAGQHVGAGVWQKPAVNGYLL